MKEYRRSPELRLLGNNAAIERYGNIWKEEWRNAAATKSNELSREYPLATIPYEEYLICMEVEDAIDDYYLQKLDRYHVPDHPRRTLPDAEYVHFPEDQQSFSQISEENFIGGFYDFITNRILIHYDPSFDALDRMRMVAHEKSHASTSNIAYAYLTADNEVTTLTELTGFSIMGNREEKGLIIEEVLAQLDEANITKSYLKERFPDLYQKRRNLIELGTFDVQISQIDPKLYGDVTIEEIAPFIAIQSTLSDEGDEIERSRLSVSLKEYLLGKRLCELVGGKILSDGYTQDEQRVTGYTLLDKERYLRTNEAHRQLVKIFGPQKVKYLFNLREHVDNIDDVMENLLT